MQDAGPYTSQSMVRPSARRLSITLFVVLSLLFSQLALASYACSARDSFRGVDHGGMTMAAGEPCEGMDGMQADQGEPVLCHQHCVNAPQSFEPMQLPAISLPAVVHVYLVPLPMDTASAEPPGSAQVGQARPPPDPLFLATLRLRV